MARNGGRQQRSKRARLHKKQALWAGLPHWFGHPSHVSYRPNRNGNPIYHPRNPGKQVL